MNFKFNNLILTVLIFCLSCHNTPTQVEQIELREDLSEAEFKKAIIGNWQSVYETPGKEIVDYLELDLQGNAKIIIKQAGNKREYQGNYRIIFLRPPTKGMVTLAELTIQTSGENIILSQVNFGLHNAVHAQVGFLLRIDKEPYGVLKKIM